MPDIGSPCDDEPEGGQCVWQIDYVATNTRGYRAMGCYAGLKGKIWMGGEEQLYSPFEPPDINCPTQVPAQYSTCPVQKLAETCIYPNNYCQCPLNPPGMWQCSNGGGLYSPPRPVVRYCAATSFDEAQLVKDMDPKVAAAWCQWILPLAGKTVVPVSGTDSPNVADSYPYHSFTTPELSLCLADLPVELCVDNLKARGSECTATIAQLDDCVESMLLASPGNCWVGHGCAPLLANPSCANVIAQPFTDQGSTSKCVVPLQ